ncbi:MAG: hypothetical protein JNL94_04320 [Planctomycetes bacterium]|nr:hypothetical protein [Planctomycetota bacterium]
MGGKQGSAGNVIAALCSFFIPGLGQMVQGRILKALFFFVVCAAGYALWFLAFPWVIAAIVHLWAIIDAATYKS